MAQVLMYELTFDKSLTAGNYWVFRTYNQPESTYYMGIDYGDGTIVRKRASSTSSQVYSIQMDEIIGNTIKIYNILDSGSFNIFFNGPTTYYQAEPTLVKVKVCEGVTELPYYVFMNNGSLREIEMHDDITSFSSELLRNTAVTDIYLPKNLTSMASKTFYSAPSSLKIHIQDLAKYCAINFEYYNGWEGNPTEYNNDGLYYNGSRITNLIIPEGVTSISNYAFKRATQLASVTFPPSCTSIGSSAFDLCSNITDVYFTGTLAQWQAMTIGSNNSPITSRTPHIVKTVNLSTNGGTLPSGTVSPLMISDFPNPMPIPTYGSFSFAGWYYDNGTFQSAVTAGGSVAESCTIYAKFNNTVTYSLNGGTNNASNPASYTSVDVTNATQFFGATKVGYKFAGWFTEATFEHEVTDMSTFTGAAVTLYAKFTTDEIFRPSVKTASGKSDVPIDAETVRGMDAYTNVNISSLNKMSDLAALINRINTKNQHAIFDASSYITGAYVCLCNMTTANGINYCEIIDLLNGKKYINHSGYSANTTVSSYISSCTVEDGYQNIKISDFTTMGQLRTYLNNVNAVGDHCFFDFSSYITGAYVCTVQMTTVSTVNYCFIFDLLNGKIYGSYTGYADSDTISTYCQSMPSDLVNAIKITNANITLADVIAIINRVNVIGHHVFLDVSALNTSDYLITFTHAASSSNTVCKAVGLVNGTIANKTYLTSALASTTLASFLATANNLGTELPSGSNDTYLHKNASTGALEFTALPDSITFEDLMPAKGQIINLNLDGTSKQYRVLKTNGTVAEVLTMFNVSDSIAFYQYGNDSTYRDCTLDVYLNTTWYGTLSDNAKSAIVDTPFQQDAWYYGDDGDPNYIGVYDPSTNYNVSFDSTYTPGTLTRHVYAPSVQDIIDYLGVTPEMTASSTTLTASNLWQMFWNDAVSHNNNIWLSSSYAIYRSQARDVYGSSGTIGSHFTTDTYAARAVFQIDLTKIDWS